jgi:glycosyltransferase involved in cell wall biosynthesis
VTRTWVIVTGHFVRTSGQGRANLALAELLQERGDRVHLVSAEVEPALATRPGVTVHQVRYPLRSHRLGEQLLDREGRRVAAQVLARDPAARVVVNGGNCRWDDVCWVHMVHAAWSCLDSGAPLAPRLKARIGQWLDRARERIVLRRARLLIANSERTRRDVTSLLGVPAPRIAVIPLGTDPDLFRPPTGEERREARRSLEIDKDAHVLAFVGVHGPELKKGFDTLVAAFHQVTRAGPDTLLVTAGAGALDRWRARLVELGLDRRVRLLGQTDQVPALLAAADLLVAPSRYDAYGLNVHEALCTGLPAITTEAAGISAVYPADLHDLVLRRADDADELARVIIAALAGLTALRARVQPLGERLRRYAWSDMAAAMVARIEDEGRAPHA